MAGIKQAIVIAAATAVIAMVPVAPAAADGRGFGHLAPWWIGRGLVGAVVGLATLPLVIASAVVTAGEQAAPAGPGYGGGPYGYAPPRQAYPVPPVYYTPRPAYYPPAYGYYSAPRSYHAPRAYYAARPAYRQRGYAYPRQ